MRRNDHFNGVKPNGIRYLRKKWWKINFVLALLDVRFGLPQHRRWDVRGAMDYTRLARPTHHSIRDRPRPSLVAVGGGDSHAGIKIDHSNQHERAAEIGRSVGRCYEIRLRQFRLSLDLLSSLSSTMISQLDC